MILHLIPLALLSAAAPGASVSLHLAAINDRILVGEPLRLDLRWHALSRQILPPTPEKYRSYSGIAIVVEHDGERREYREAYSAIREEMTTAPPVPAGADVHWDLLLHHGRYAPFTSWDEPQLALAEPGQWSVQVRYGAARSNWVSVTVSAPVGDDQTVLKALSKELFALKYGGPAAEALLTRHPESRYLLPARVSRAELALQRLQSGRDAATGQELRATERVEARRQGQQLSVQLQERTWGPYEQERLALLVQSAEAAGDAKLATRALKQLRDTYPHCRAAQVLGRAHGTARGEPR